MNLEMLSNQKARDIIRAQKEFKDIEDKLANYGYKFISAEATDEVYDENSELIDLEFEFLYESSNGDFFLVDTSVAYPSKGFATFFNADESIERQYSFEDMLKNYWRPPNNDKQR